jgi:hypothetical protein
MKTHSTTPGRRRFALVALVGLFSAWRPACAVPISILNSSFESSAVSGGGAANFTPSAAGWTAVGSGTVGASYLSFAPVGLGGAAQGQQAAYLDANANGVASLGQTLATALEADTVYTLSIAVARWANGAYNPGASYAVSLFAGNTSLTSVTPVILAGGAWTVLSATYTSAGIVAPNQFLGISISTFGGGAGIRELLVDDVRLDAARSATVPDGGSVQLFMGVAMAGLWLMRSIESRGGARRHSLRAT